MDATPDTRVHGARRAAPLARILGAALAASALLAPVAAPAQAPQLTPPRIVEEAAPAYPPEALAAGVEGRVVLRLTIDAHGSVIAAEVVESAGHGFDEAALAAAREIRFSPALRGETPVASRILYAHEFRLPPAPAEPEPAPQAAPAEEGELQVIVRKQSEADRLRRSAEAVQVLELEGEHREAADLGEVLARTEGVGVRRGGGLGSGTRFSLAGLTDDQIRFFIDGIPLELAGHPFGISNVPVNLIDRVEIYRGVVPIRFGADALGGAVNLVSRRERAGTHGFASYQIGSFGTHRLAAGASHRDDASGFFARATGFHDQAENDYSVTAENFDYATARTLPPAEFERFHDAYRGSGAEVEVGLVDRPWARRISLQAFLSDFDKEIQHDQVMRNPYGDATWGELSGGLDLRYEQALSHDTRLHAVVGWTHERSHLLDVGTCIYDWNGDCVGKRNKPGEIDRDPRDQVHETDSLFGRILFDWELGFDHTLRLSLAPTAATRTGDERRQATLDQVDPLNARRDLFTHVGGLEYQANLLGGRLENIAFVKSYLQVVRSEEPRGGNVFIDRDRDTHHLGFGDALRYRFVDWLWAKASWEMATRLPRPDEIFGDGGLIDPNLELEPERSQNFNLGATIDARTTGGDFRFDVNGFLRDTDRLIILYGYENFYKHQNVYAARSLGVEGAAGWTAPGGLFAVDGNATWVDLRNTSADGVFGSYEGDRIPNRPWFFANLALRFVVRDTVGAGDHLELAWQSRYVHGFFRDWESNGATEFKQKIPSQLLHSVTATQQVKSPIGALTFGAEVQNLADETAYDFYGLQRPGRSFHFKTTAEF